MQPLSVEDVRKVAALAKLELTDDQVERARVQLAAVLGHMERLAEVDVEGVEPMARPDESVHHLAADEPTEPLSAGVLMGMAPDSHAQFVRVPKVLGNPSS